VGMGSEFLAAVTVRIAADNQLARHEVDLFPVFVHEGHRGVDARMEAQVARAKSGSLLLAERAGEDLLLDAGRVARRHFPAPIQVDGVELLVFLVDRHLSSLRSLSRPSPGSSRHTRG